MMIEKHPPLHLLPSLGRIWRQFLLLQKLSLQVNVSPLITLKRDYQPRRSNLFHMPRKVSLNVRQATP
jgi:hypothetical protein